MAGFSDHERWNYAVLLLGRGERGEFTRKLTAMTVMPEVNEGD
jgi:hypothetical protein